PGPRNRPQQCRTRWLANAEQRAVSPRRRLERASTARSPTTPAHPQELRPVLEVHGVVVIPAPTPDEAVLLENAHDLHRDLILVGERAVLAGCVVAPVVGALQRDVDGDALAMRGNAGRAGDDAAVEGAGRREEEHV